MSEFKFKVIQIFETGQGYVIRTGKANNFPTNGEPLARMAGCATASEVAELVFEQLAPDTDPGPADQ